MTKEETIKQFEDKYKVKWNEQEALITIENKYHIGAYVWKRGYLIHINDFGECTWGNKFDIEFDVAKSCNFQIPLSFIEDLLNILHLYYLRNKNIIKKEKEKIE